ncbi:metal transporter [Actinomadura sp. NAK00032]|uniref:metal transporter n=1 Tax=Actinomadura sp. NAK00032 TaxID=2742128 RepID=UPI00159200EC|nr:metal transporter [Actinomadura sp. NAK00032]QKW34508.1 metal transporter [Actinomadura sp. NAK00032]
MENNRGNAADRSYVLLNIGLGLMFALGSAFTALMLAVSWGGAYCVFTTAVAVVVSGLALLRGRRRVWPAAAGLTVAAGAVGVSLATDLPQEPAPTTALALAVLIGSALRAVPAPSAACIAVGGVAVIALGWVSGVSAVTALATILIVGGLAAGVLLRAIAPVPPSDTPITWPT